MITEQDLLEAIAECQGQRNPTANTCLKLAAYLTIHRELYGTPDSPEIPIRYSFSDSPPLQTEKSIELNSGTEFSDAISKMKPKEAWDLMDELMSTLQIVNPRLYASVMRKIT